MNDVVITGDRIMAFLIINGKVYESDGNHQECLVQYFRDAGIESEFDYSDASELDSVHEAAVARTFEMKESHEAYGFDLFDTSTYGMVLLAHDKETLYDCVDWVREYCNRNSDDAIKVGFFDNDAVYHGEYKATLVAG